MSMENFFNWMSQPVPKDDVIIWFNVHNLNYEKIELYGDFFKSLNQIILDTYLGDEGPDTRIIMSKEDNILHFEWCWTKWRCFTATSNLQRRQLDYIPQPI